MAGPFLPRLVKLPFVRRPGCRLACARRWAPTPVRRWCSLSLNSTTSLAAGAFLGSITGTLEKYPGLLVLVPAAIGMRGNIFGSFGNRVSTTIHAGTFTLSTRRDTLLGQNVLAAGILTIAISLAAAILTKAIAVGLGLEGTIGVLDLTTISIVGGVLGFGGRAGRHAGAHRRRRALRLGPRQRHRPAGLDPRRRPRPCRPCWLATFAIGIAFVVGVARRRPHGRCRCRARLGVANLTARAAAHRAGSRCRCLVVAAGLSADGRHRPREELRRLQRLPGPAGPPAGVRVVGRCPRRDHVEAGSPRKLFLGLLEPESWPARPARADIAFVYLLFVPIYAFNGIGAHYVARALGERSPGLGEMVLLALLAGAIAMVFVVLVAYYGTIVAFRTGVDPDTYGIPVVSSSVDFLGAITLIVTISLLAIT